MTKPSTRALFTTAALAGAAFADYGAAHRKTTRTVRRLVKKARDVLRTDADFRSRMYPRSGKRFSRGRGNQHTRRPSGWRGR